MPGVRIPPGVLLDTHGAARIHWDTGRSLFVLFFCFAVLLFFCFTVFLLYRSSLYCSSVLRFTVLLFFYISVLQLSRLTVSQAAVPEATAVSSPVSL